MFSFASKCSSTNFCFFFCVSIFIETIDCQLVENHDAIWDDGVAPEITIDFDASHISRKEGLLSWLGGLAFFTTLYNLLRLTDPESKNPAVNRKMDVVIGNPKTSFSAGEEEKKEEAAAQDEEEEEDADDDDE